MQIHSLRLFTSSCWMHTQFQTQACLWVMCEMALNINSVTNRIVHVHSAYWGLGMQLICVPPPHQISCMWLYESNCKYTVMLKHTDMKLCVRIMQWMNFKNTPSLQRWIIMANPFFPLITISFFLNLLHPHRSKWFISLFLDMWVLFYCCQWVFSCAKNWAGLWFLCNIKTKTFIIEIYHGTASQMVWVF